ncbi:hypothetical protein DERF_008157 [Dermatophagoides farinae]|uniref:Uncharacterized protein n=1 Tax=Dermatophagoides farinae TaxID=6954 RepID=A0A922L6Q0_DERFA|nr:hypothetical protein DERF_008157 [Dermatophagoides farinae]
MVGSIATPGCEYTEAIIKPFISMTTKSVYDSDDIIIGVIIGLKIKIQLRTGKQTLDVGGLLLIG